MRRLKAGSGLIAHREGGATGRWPREAARAGGEPSASQRGVLRPLENRRWTSHAEGTLRVRRASFVRRRSESRSSAWRGSGVALRVTSEVSNG